MSDQYPPQNPYGHQPYGQQPQNPYGQQPPYGQTAPTGPGGEPPLWAPWYGISFVNAFKRYFKKYVRFDGRASRSEFWWVYLWNLIIAAVLGIFWGIGFAMSGRETYSTPTGVTTVVTSPSPLYIIMGIVFFLWGLAILLPSLSLAWRRLHDANFAGPFFFLGFIPFVGGIILLVFYLMGSRPEGARFDRPDGMR